MIFIPVHKDAGPRDNKALTEAAPDLYDALADLVGQCERDDPVIVIGRALAALRKARGDA